MSVTRVPLRKLNGILRLALPARLIKELGLRPGDYVDLVQDDGDVRLRFVKVASPAELNRAEQGQLAEAS
jgi:hypothetical protein